MSIRRVIFTSGQNVKPPFLCQYFIFFDDFFFALEISFGYITITENRNLKKIADLKVYVNLDDNTGVLGIVTSFKSTLNFCYIVTIVNVVAVDL